MSDELDLPLPTRRATRRLGSALGESVRAGDVLFLEGPLGAGKTFLVRALARALGVPASVPIQSPTFALVHVHPLPRGGALVHADLYRLSAPEALRDLELGEDPRAVLCVEWGERFRDEIAPPWQPGSLTVTLDATPRRARLRAHGERGRALLASVRDALATVPRPE